MPLSLYAYDALDRLVKRAQKNLSHEARLFYCEDLLATDIQGAVRNSFFRLSDSLLAQHKHLADETEKSLLCIDPQGSVVGVVSKSEYGGGAYTPYGYHSQVSSSVTSMGYTGQYRDPVTGFYILGNGYRAFNPIMMRFNSPDSLSPFKEGGTNAYAYCKGDPINFQDDSGRFPLLSLIRVLNQGIKPIKTSSALSVAVDGAHKFFSKSMPIPPEGFRLVGYHGSKSKHIANLAKNGLDSSYMGRNLRADFGPGFYVSPNISVARGYAKPSQRFNGIGFKKPNSVGAVFVRDLASKSDGHHFQYISAHGTHQEQLVLRPQIYSDVLVMPINSFKSAKRPEFYSDIIRKR